MNRIYTTKIISISSPVQWYKFFGKTKNTITFLLNIFYYYFIKYQDFFSGIFWMPIRNTFFGYQTSFEILSEIV